MIVYSDVELHAGKHYASFGKQERFQISELTQVFEKTQFILAKKNLHIKY